MAARGQLGTHPPHAGVAACVGVQVAHHRDQVGVGRRPGRGAGLAPVVVARRGHAQFPAHERHRVFIGVRPVCDSSELHCFPFANQVATFFANSTCICNSAVFAFSSFSSARSRINSSRSDSLNGASAGTEDACLSRSFFTHLPNVISCTPILRATSTTGRPPSITKATASALYSSVKLRRVDPTIHTPLTKGSYIAYPENRGRSSRRSGVSVVGHGGGDFVGGVAGEVVAVAVVAAGGAGGGVADGVLHVAQRGAFVEGGGDEGGPHGVRADAFGVGDAGVAGEAANEAPGGDPVEGGAGGGGEDRPFGAVADQGVERDEDAGGERGGGALVAFAPVAEHSVAFGDGEVVNAGADGFADAQPVGKQQRDQGIGAGAVGAGGGAELSALLGAEPGGGVFVVGAGAFDVGEGGADDGVLAGGVAVEAVQG